MTVCKKEEKEMPNNVKQNKLEIKNPNFVLVDKNFISGNCIGELYINMNNVADTLFIIKKMNSDKSNTTWEGTLEVTVTPIEGGGNKVTYDCCGTPSNCKGTCSFDSEGNISGCRINILN